MHASTTFEARFCTWWLCGYFLRWLALLTFCLAAGYKNYFGIFQVDSVHIGINTDQLIFDKVFLMETKCVKAGLFLDVNRILHKKSMTKGAYIKNWNAQREDSNANNLLNNTIRVSMIVREWTNLWFHLFLFELGSTFLTLLQHPFQLRILNNQVFRSASQADDVNYNRRFSH